MNLIHDFRSWLDDNLLNVHDEDLDQKHDFKAE